MLIEMKCVHTKLSKLVFQIAEKARSVEGRKYKLEGHTLAMFARLLQLRFN